MSKKGNRVSIIDSISNWIKLLGLIVLVAEVIMLAAMSQTPVENPMYPWYPLIMIFLLIIIIVAVFLDRILGRNSQTLSISVDDKELSIDPVKNRTKKIENESTKYVNGLLGYSFDKLKGDGWKVPKEISFKEYIQQIFLLEDIDDEYLQTIVSANNPFGMLLYQANILEVQKSDSIVIGFDDLTTTESVEHSIAKIIELKKLDGIELSEEDIVNLRRNLNQTNGIDRVGFGVKFNVMTFNKLDLNNKSIQLGLPNLFMTLSMGSPEPIDSLTSNENTILWTTSNKLRNCIINGERVNSFYVYRLYQLVQNQNYIYLTQVQWSPQMESAVFAWDELKRAFESFKIEQ